MLAGLAGRGVLRAPRRLGAAMRVLAARSPTRPMHPIRAHPCWPPARAWCSVPAAGGGKAAPPKPPKLDTSKLQRRARLLGVVGLGVAASYTIMKVCFPGVV